ncbi:MAG TPA: DNA polymerase IV, partial [Paraburkholderia sp.]
LLEKGFARRSKSVRLLGVGVRLEEDSLAKHGQFDLFDYETADEIEDAHEENPPADETLEADIHSDAVHHSVETPTRAVK